MINVQMLEAKDSVSPDDWCRPLSLCTLSGGLGDGMSFRSMYTRTPENNVKWVKVRDVLGKIWHKKTVKEISDALIPMEFVRGNVPTEHQLNMQQYNSLASSAKQRF